MFYGGYSADINDAMADEYEMYAGYDPYDDYYGDDDWYPHEVSYDDETGWADIESDLPF